MKHSPGSRGVLLISGPIAVGKTATAVAIADGTVGVKLIRVREALAEVLGTGMNDRRVLQQRGAELDQRTRGRWLVNYLEHRLESMTLGESVVIDSLRTIRQTEPVLDRLTDSRLVYLEAHEETRRQRYARAVRADLVKRSLPFDDAMRHPTEIAAHSVRHLAHLVIATDELSIAQVVEQTRAVAPWIN